MKSLTAPLILSALALSIAHTARTEPIAASQPVRFAPNADPVTIAGGVVGGARDLYHFDATAGQQVSIGIKAPAESAVFQLYRPGYKIVAERNGASVTGETLAGAGKTDDARAWKGALSISGRYLIVVSGVHGVASYRLSVTLK